MTDLALELSGQVTAAVENSDGTANIYITQDQSLNELTLTLTNSLSGPVIFPPGTPVAYQDLPAGQSAVYLFLNGLIDNPDVAGIAMTAPGWAAGTFTGSDSLQYLVIAPVAAVTMPPGGTLTFRLAKVLAGGSPRSGTADLDLAGATGVTSLQSDVPLFVNLASPSQPGDQALEVKIGFRRPEIYTGQPQSLTLYLVNGGQQVLVPGGASSWHTTPPTFQLTLVYGHGTGAVTTVAQAAQLAMEISDSYGNQWKAPQRQVQGQNPYWVLQPDRNGGGTVLGTGEQATIEFTLTGIDATLPAGLDSAITLAYVSWHDIPGYSGGSMPVIITKRAGPQVTGFAADPLYVHVGQPSLQTVLTWEAAQADYVTFDAPGVSSAEEFQTSGSGPVPGGIAVTRGTTLTVTAYKDVSAQLAGAPPDGDDLISASKTLLITGPDRLDLTAGVGSLGAIVIPPGSTRAFIFQLNAGEESATGLTKCVLLDLKSRTFTGTVDLASLVPSSNGDVEIEAVAPSPDGKTIHVIASSGASSGTPVYYFLPLDVVSATYGKPVSIGSPDFFALLAIADGRTLCVSTYDLGSGGAHLLTFDAASYAPKDDWTWPAKPFLGPLWPVASSADGGQLLISGMFGMAIIDVTRGLTVTGVLNTLDQFKLVILPPAVRPDNSRAYFLAGTGDDNLAGTSDDDSVGHLLAIDIDLGTGALRLEKDILLGPVSAGVGKATLSPDARTFYLMVAADALTAYDASTFTTVQYYCGSNGDFAPLLIVSGEEPGVLYCTGHNDDTTGTVSVVTLPVTGSGT